MPEYFVRYTQVVHQTWYQEYDANSQDEAEAMLIQEMNDGWDCNDDIVDAFFETEEVKK